MEESGRAEEGRPPEGPPRREEAVYEPAWERRRGAGMVQGPYPPRKGYVGLILVGIVLISVGAIVIVSTGFIDDPQEPEYDEYSDYGDYEEEYQDYVDEREEYTDNVRVIQAIGNVLEYVGLMIFCIGIVMGSLTDESVSPYIRLGLLVAMGFVLGSLVGGTIIYYW